jgi:hypothetical protein
VVEPGVSSDDPLKVSFKHSGVCQKLVKILSTLVLSCMDPTRLFSADLD